MLASLWFPQRKPKMIFPLAYCRKKVYDTDRDSGLISIKCPKRGSVHGDKSVQNKQGIWWPCCAGAREGKCSEELVQVKGVWGARGCGPSSQGSSVLAILSLTAATHAPLHGHTGPATRGLAVRESLPVPLLGLRQETVLPRRSAEMTRLYSVLSLTHTPVGNLAKDLSDRVVLIIRRRQSFSHIMLTNEHNFHEV